MNTTVVTIIGVFLCTGPLWGAAIGYVVAQRGYRLRSPFHQASDDSE